MSYKEILIRILRQPHSRLVLPWRQGVVHSFDFSELNCKAH